MLALVEANNADALKAKLFARFDAVIEAAKAAVAAALAAIKESDLDGKSDEEKAQLLEARRAKISESRIAPLDAGEREVKLAHLLVHLSQDAAWQKRTMAVVGLRRYVKAVAAQAPRFYDMAQRVAEEIRADQRGFFYEVALLVDLARDGTDLTNRQANLKNQWIAQAIKEKDFVSQRETHLADLKNQLTKLKTEVDAMLAKQSTIRPVCSKSSAGRPHARRGLPVRGGPGRAGAETAGKPTARQVVTVGGGTGVSPVRAKQHRPDACATEETNRDTAMMTPIGKTLAFVNLLIGLAMLAWSVTIYTQRPAWLDPKPESIAAGQHPLIIAQLKDDIDNLGRAAASASANWGVQRKQLEDQEALRAARKKGYAERLEWARNSNKNDKDLAGFYEPLLHSSGPLEGLLDLSATGAPIKGPDNLPLKGVNRLGGQFAADVAEVIKQSKMVDGYRDQFKLLSGQVLDTETRALKMGQIRDAVQSELFYLATVEVNVFETRETVLRRKGQLTRRLAELGVKP